MQLFKMGELFEGEIVAQAWVNLRWDDQVTVFAVCVPWLTSRFCIKRYREVYGWWAYCFGAIRYERDPLPCPKLWTWEFLLTEKHKC